MMKAFGSTYFAARAVAAGLLAVVAEQRIEAQAVERAESVVALVEAQQAQRYRTISLAAGIADDRLHLRQQIGAQADLGLLRGSLVGFFVIEL